MKYKKNVQNICCECVSAMEHGTAHSSLERWVNFDEEFLRFMNNGYIPSGREDESFEPAQSFCYCSLCNEKPGLQIPYLFIKIIS